MKKFVLVLLVLLSVIVFVIRRNNTNNSEKIRILEGSIESGLALSNLHKPVDIGYENISSNKVTIFWNFKNNKFYSDIIGDNTLTEITGFRIFRDGFWVTDVDSNKFSFTDYDLYPGETYVYTVAALTNDNKVQGMESEKIEVKTPDGKANSVGYSTKSVYNTLFVEGASVAEGQQVPPGLSWAEQVASYLIKNGSDNLQLFNRAISGSLSSEVARRISLEISNLEEREGISPDLVIIDSAGINDLVPSGDLRAKVRGDLSMSDFRKNVEEIIRQVKPSNDRNLILLNINYFKCCINEGSIERNDKKRVAWNKILRDIANAHGIIFVDVEKAMIESGVRDFHNGEDGQYLLQDELHPSHAGHVIITNAILDALDKHRQ